MTTITTDKLGTKRLETKQQESDFLHSYLKDYRDERVAVMNDTSESILAALGFPSKTLKMLIEREDRNNRKFPNKGRAQTLAIFKTLFENRDKIIAKLKANGLSGVEFPD